LELAKQQGVQAEVRYLHGGLPFLSDVDHPAFQVAQDALQAAFGKPCVFSREGGSVPFVRSIADLLQKPCLLIGFGTPDQNAHAPNEWLGLENYRHGISAMIHLYRGLAKL
jgi:acetylornithine deacetylase/succinyl-diaminopimelate desuccinylase-like protein